MKKIFLTCALLVFFPLFAFAANNDVQAAKEIQNTVNDFAVAWNFGDIDKILNFYKNDSILINSDSIIKGHQNIATFFTTNYSQAAQRGKLSFSDIEIKPLSDKFGMVIGKWTIDKSQGPSAHGAFGVLYEKTKDGWQIAIDQTSGL